MKLSAPRYTFCLFFQFIFIFCDIIFNCVSLFPRSRDGLLVLFIFQDLFIVLSITTMLITFFSTYLFQTGLAGALARRGAGAGVCCAAYGALSLTLHARTLRTHSPLPFPPSPHAAPATDIPLLALFVAHRCLSPWYYFMYKRAALRAADPRFYEDIDWISAQLRARPRPLTPAAAHNH